MSIYIGFQTKTLSDMKGPCPDGFHVPTQYQRIYIYNTGVSLGAWNSAGGANLATYLKLPKAGIRDGTNSNTYYVGEYGYYWTSIAYVATPGTNTQAYVFIFGSSIYTDVAENIAGGHPIRAMKDTPVIPTSSWTTLYQGSGSAGIFRNQTDGLISLSSNGTTWYTIMDKNLGATTVWNNGNTLTDANCGNVFQRGNCYGFPGTKSSASITTSSTAVSVTGYGPGNYYSSSTWITKNRQNSDNLNLRGGQTQGTYTEQIPQEVKNIYIGEYKTRHYDYTFKGKTAAEIGNEWTTQVGTITVNSDGVTGTSSQDVRITKNIPSLATAKRIVINSTVVGINNVYTAGAVGIGSGAGWGTYVANFNIYGSQYNGIRLELYDGASNYGNTIGTATAATYDATLTIDGENKTMTGSIPGFSDSVLTLTDAWISLIRAYEYIVCYTSANRSTISDVSIDIIY